jgi:hypothetical protein
MFLLTSRQEEEHAQWRGTAPQADQERLGIHHSGMPTRIVLAPM